MKENNKDFERLTLKPSTTFHVTSVVWARSQVVSMDGIILYISSRLGFRFFSVTKLFELAMYRDKTVNLLQFAHNN